MGRADRRLQGVGDALVSYLITPVAGLPGRTTLGPLDPVLEEHFAFVTRPGGSPATRAFMALAEQHIGALQGLADAGRVVKAVP